MKPHPWNDDRYPPLPYAREYADLGLRIVPLYESSKAPRIQRWPERGTTDRRTVSRWFRRWPESNVAVLTGGGLVALDVDPKRGGRRSFDELTRGRPLPHTAHALTGGGGEHYLFRIPPEVEVRTRDNLLPGLEIKGEGGAIVVEPSVHPRTGKWYTWTVTPRQVIADAPGWLIGLVSESGAGPRSTCTLNLSRVGDEAALLADAIGRFPVTGHGQRNGVMLKLVCSLLGRGFNEDMIEDVISGWWCHYYEEGTIRTSPSEAATEIRATVRATLARGTLRRAVGIDHEARSREIRLAEEVMELLRDGMVAEGRLLLDQEERNTPLRKRVTTRQKFCRNHRERAFVEAWIVHFTHKLRNTSERTMKATRDQIRQIIEVRHGIKLENTQFERLKRRFITRPDKPAARFELAIQTLEGRPGVPSEFRLTGLIKLLSPEASRALQERSLSPDDS